MKRYGPPCRSESWAYGSSITAGKTYECSLSVLVLIVLIPVREILSYRTLRGVSSAPAQCLSDRAGYVGLSLQVFNVGFEPRTLTSRVRRSAD